MDVVVCGGLWWLWWFVGGCGGCGGFWGVVVAVVVWGVHSGLRWFVVGCLMGK